jgi:hypothetical protein
MMVGSSVRTLGLVLALGGCSFFLVKGPPNEYVPATVQCTDSDVVPSIDAVGGVFAIAGAVGGEFVTQLTDHKVDHYELFYALPLVVAGIVYLVASSHGTEKVTSCRAAKEGESVGCDGCPARVP